MTGVQKWSFLTFSQKLLQQFYWHLYKPWPTTSSAEVNERVQLYLYFPSGPSWPVIEGTLPLPLHDPCCHFSHSCHFLRYQHKVSNLAAGAVRRSVDQNPFAEAFLYAMNIFRRLAAVCPSVRPSHCKVVAAPAVGIAGNSEQKCFIKFAHQF